MADTPPTETIRDGNIKASIWENQGEKGPFYTTTFSKTYRDADGNFRDIAASTKATCCALLNSHAHLTPGQVSFSAKLHAMV